MRTYWKYFNTEKELEEEKKSGASWYNIQIGKFDGPGNYFVKTYSKRCPRNCCDDLVIKIIPAKDRIREIETEMYELAGALKFARAQLCNKES